MAKDRSSSKDCELDTLEGNGPLFGNGALFGNGSIPNRCTYNETAVWNTFETAADFAPKMKGDIPSHHHIDRKVPFCHHPGSDGSATAAERRLPHHVTVSS